MRAEWIIASAPIIDKPGKIENHVFLADTSPLPCLGAHRSSYPITQTTFRGTPAFPLYSGSSPSLHFMQAHRNQREMPATRVPFQRAPCQPSSASTPHKRTYGLSKNFSRH